MCPKNGGITYYLDFIEFDYENKKNNSRLVKIFVPVDCKLIATKLNIDNDIVFGRLYYYLNLKYSKPEMDIHLFKTDLGADKRKHVNMPLLASVLAKLQNDEKRYRANLYTNKQLTFITFLAASAAIASVFVAVFK